MVAKKKTAVRDKYYTLAKEQGYRARSAFKLVQLNKKYNVLANAKRVIDLCAAPGGWLQVCAKTMPMTAETQIIGVDLMPIRPIKGVVTFQEDITSDKCKSIIKKEMKGNKADVVLCDGAPNVGANYSKDAFVQNELTVHALKFACDHLAKGGIFITKVFRSSDYNALMWSFQQLFTKVEATKPDSSRNVSAEIFVVCRNFLAPAKVDPKLLDPKYVLEQVNETVDMNAAQAATNLFHKKAGQKKNRAGYDPSIGQGLFRSISAADFVFGESPMPMLASANSIALDSEDSVEIASHQHTTEEIKEYLRDLKVLGKGELRHILNWRKKLKELLKPIEAESASESEIDDSEEEEDDDDSRSDDSDEIDDLETELSELKKEELKKKKREKQKNARIRTKLQHRRDLGIDNKFAIDLADQETPFSLKSLGIKNAETLDLIREVNLSSAKKTDIPNHEADSDEDSVNFGDEEELDPKERKAKYDREMEENIENHYLQSRNMQESAEPLTVQQRRQLIQAEKKAKLKKRTLEKLAAEDLARVLEQEELEQIKGGAYLKHLQKQGAESDSDDESEAESSSNESEDDSQNDDEIRKAAKFETYSESEEESGSDQDDIEDMSDDNSASSESESDGKPQKKKKEVVMKRAKENPLLIEFQERDIGAEKRAKRFFDQKLFDGVESDDDNEDHKLAKPDNESDDDEEDSDNSDTFVPLPSGTTEKHKRKERRAKLKKRNERKLEKRKQAAEKELGGVNHETLSGFETVKASKGKRSLDELFDDDDNDKNEGKTPEQIANENKTKRLIARGIGKVDSSGEKSGFEVVPASISKSADSDSDSDEEEKYNSEDYDTDERAQHLALGSILTKKAKRRKLLDAAYNRYAFNDDGLPDWFVADENRHNRPQLPISKEMVENIKARYKDLVAKPINKVAEARARKQKRARSKLESVKRKAAAVIEQEDINAKSKMRAIEKLYKGAEIKKPNSVYVVAKNGGKGKVNVAGMRKGQKVKLVDRRMKADKGRGDQAKRRQAKLSGKRYKKRR